MIQVGAQEHDAIGFAFLADQHGLLHFVGFLVNVVGHAYIAVGFHQGLHVFQNADEQHVLGAFDDDGDPETGLQFQVLGVGVGLKVVAPYDVHDPGAGRVTDVRTVVQYAGHRADGIAGFAGNIPDRHGRSLLCKDIFF